MTEPTPQPRRDTTEQGFPPRPEQAEPVGAAAHRTIASYPSYAEAQAAVDRLSDAKFPVERVRIIGTGLRFEEQVTGRYNYGRAALSGAGTGAIIGIVIGWLFGLFNWMDPVAAGLLLALYGLILGAILGAIVGLIGHALTGGRRDFSSVSGMRAERYEVQVDSVVADDAAGLLETTTGPPGRAEPEAEAPESPRATPGETPVGERPGDRPGEHRPGT